MKERMKKHPLLTKVVIALLCGLTFYLLGFPCRIFLKISDTTEVRLVAALPMLFSMTFGLPGALGCAFANLFSDIQDTPPPSSYRDSSSRLSTGTFPPKFGITSAAITSTSSD